MSGVFGMPEMTDGPDVPVRTDRCQQNRPATRTSDHHRPPSSKRIAQRELNDSRTISICRRRNGRKRSRGGVSVREPELDMIESIVELCPGRKGDALHTASRTLCKFPGRRSELHLRRTCCAPLCRLFQYRRSWRGGTPMRGVAVVKWLDRRCFYRGRTDQGVWGVRRNHRNSGRAYFR